MEEAARLKEKRLAFEQARENIARRRQEEQAKRDEKIKEFRKHQMMVDAHMAEFERQKHEAWEEQRQASANRMMGTARSFTSAVAAEAEERMDRWNRDMGNTETRIALQREARTQSAREHSLRHRAQTERFRGTKEAKDEVRRVEYGREMAETSARLDAITSARAVAETRRQRELRDEFSMKSTTEDLRWLHTVKKSPVPVVRSDLQTKRVPIPSYAPS